MRERELVHFLDHVSRGEVDAKAYLPKVVPGEPDLAADRELLFFPGQVYNDLASVTARYHSPADCVAVDQLFGPIRISEEHSHETPAQLETTVVGIHVALGHDSSAVCKAVAGLAERLEHLGVDRVEIDELAYLLVLLADVLVFDCRFELPELILVDLFRLHDAQEGPARDQEGGEGLHELTERVAHDPVRELLGEVSSARWRDFVRHEPKLKPVVKNMRERWLRGSGVCRQAEEHGGAHDPDVRWPADGFEVDLHMDRHGCCSIIHSVSSQGRAVPVWSRQKSSKKAGKFQISSA
jgi:hypothetical protein